MPIAQVSHAKYLRAKTVLRSYHHITADMVNNDGLGKARREVECLPGTSSIV